LHAPPEPPVSQRRFIEGIALLLLAVSAILFQRSATAPWTESTAADGTRYAVSPIGVTAFTGDGSSPVTECRWWPRLGNQQLCALNDIGGPQQMTRLRRAYPLTVFALWASVLALFLNALKVPRQARGIRSALALAPTVLGLVAFWSVWSGAPRALAVLEGLAPSPVWRGAGPVLLAILFTATAAALLATSRR
jgi:hypothetical protein